MSNDDAKESLVRISCCQMEPKVGEKEENIEKALRLMEEAIGMGADVILLPELASTGYVFDTRKESYELSEEVPGGDASQAWGELARERGVYIAAGITEKDGERLYNSSALFGPGGYIGKYRKLHLWNREKLFFEPGNLGLPVFSTPFGRLGMYICYDMWFPEVTRIYSMLGVDLILNVANWVCSKDSQDEDGRLTEAVCLSQANLNSVFIAAADRVGVERGQPFLGRSMIVSPTGKLLAGPASYDLEEIVSAECNLMEARIGRQRTRLNHVAHDRRTDVYDLLLGYDDAPFRRLRS